MTHHSNIYKTLEEVGDYSLGNLKLVFNTLPKLTRNAYPGITEDEVLRNCAIISCAYLSGGRISEVIDLKVKNISKEEDWLIVRLPNRKNKKLHYKDIIVNIKVEKVFIRYLVKYFIRKSMDTDQDDYLFKSDRKVRICRTTAYLIFKRIVKTNPHFFRKLRASHLLEYYGFDAKMLQQYLGWSSIISSEPYLKISKFGMKARYMENSERVKRLIGDD
jgi:site-specific recombinase XerD